jgi:hypothetical protein
MIRKTAVAVFALAALGAHGAAVAKPGQGKGPKHQDHKESADIDVRVVLGDRERGIVRDYYGSSCPPGLAKKNNGCLPPGQAKKRYEVGRRIPDGWDYLPDDLIVRLPPLGDGYGYRMIDGDLVVVAIATLIVLDAVGLY